MKRLLIATLLAGSLAAVPALGAPPAPATPPASSIEPVISAAWARATAPGQPISAAYLTIENHSDAPDALLAASCSCAGTVELHTMKQEGERMKMERVERIEVPAHGKVELAPGGFHIMLFDLKGPLQAEQPLTLTLRFEKAGEVAVVAIAKAPGKHMGKDMGHGG